LFEWLLSDRGHPIFDVVDPAALEGLQSQPIEGRQRMAFWNLVQAKLAIDTEDWSTLAPWRSAPPPAFERVRLPFADTGEITTLSAQELKRLREIEKLAGSYGRVIAALRDAELDPTASSLPKK
jgi:hypothetical protein